MGDSYSPGELSLTLLAYILTPRLAVLIAAMYYCLQSFGAVEAAGGHPRLLVTAAKLLSSDGRNNK